MNKILLSFLTTAAFCAAAAEKVYPVFYKQDPGIVIDGKLTHDDWNDIKNELKFLPGKGKQGNGRTFKFKGPGDLSATVKSAYRADGLYFAFNVTDDRHRQKSSGAMAYKGDHVEILIDLQPTLGGKETKFGKKQFQILLSPGSLDGKIKPESYMYFPVKQNLSVPVAALKTSSGYTLEAFIPWHVLGLKKQPATQLEKTIGIDFLISDTDGEAPHQEKYLFAGKSPFDIKRGRLLPAYLSDSRGTVPAEIGSAGEKVLAKDLMLDAKQKKISFTVEFDKSPGIVPILKLTGYNFSAQSNYAGYSPILKLAVNGKAVVGRMLRNKPNQIIMRNGRKYTFVTQRGEICLPYTKNLRSLPGYGHRNYIFRDRQDWCSFEFDLSELIRKGKNIITAEIPVFKGNKVYSVVITELSTGRTGTPSRVKKGAPAGPLPVIVPVAVVPVAAQFAFDAKKNEIAVTHNGEKYLVRSFWSIPEGKLVAAGNKYFSL